MSLCGNTFSRSFPPGYRTAAAFLRGAAAGANMLLSSLVDRFSQTRVLCIGDVMLDHFVYGTIDRISPEAPVPVFNYGREANMLGGAGNVMANCAALGSRVSAVCALGCDEAGRHVRSLLEGFADDMLIVEEKNAPTVEKTRIIAGGNHILRIDSEKNVAVNLFADAGVEARLADLMERCDVVLLSDYRKGMLSPENCRRILALACETGRSVIVDPKGSDYSRYAGATLIKPNLKEFSQVTGMEFSPESADFESRLIRGAALMFERYAVENIIVTLSEYGMAYMSSAHPGDILHISTEAREVADVSGAGDTSLAVLGVSLASGADIQDAMKLANIAAGIVVGKVGTARVLPEELKESLSRRAGAGTGPRWSMKKKIVTRAEASAIAESLHREGRSIGFTNGCFDLLHLGHLSSFLHAKSCCDVLMVGLNADASVRRLKGPGRPVQDEKTRALLLASLDMVDYVIPFEEDTALSLVEAVRPDVLVKEGYREGENWPEADLVRAFGGRVVTPPRLEGCSTSGIVARIRG